MLISLVYGSKAVRKMPNDELLDLLSKSKTNNEKLGITGMLLYQNGNFLQVLEGEEQTVEQLYEKICADPRHHKPITYLKHEIKEREFGKWHMSFINLDLAKYRKLPGYSDFLIRSDTSERFIQNPTEAYVLLKNFKDYMR